MQWGAVTSVYLSDTKRNDTSPFQLLLRLIPSHTNSLRLIPSQRHNRINGEKRGGAAPRGKIRWGPAAAGVGPAGQGDRYTPNAYPRGHRGRVAPKLNMYPSPTPNPSSSLLPPPNPRKLLSRTCTIRDDVSIGVDVTGRTERGQKVYILPFWPLLSWRLSVA